MKTLIEQVTTTENTELSNALTSEKQMLIDLLESADLHLFRDQIPSAMIKIGEAIRLLES